jgi:uncharacterized protein YbjT (DUF2867 family)
MRIGVLGGTGAAGGATVTELLRRGHQVTVLGRRAGDPRADHRTLDVVTGGGLGTALVGLEAVVECLNATRNPRRVLVDGVRRALAAAGAAGVGHVVSLSVVGCDRMPLAYYRVKVEQEAVVRAASLPATVVRATQFHTLLDHGFTAVRRLGVLPAPRGALQPVDLADVAAALADAVERGAGPDTAIAGPEILPVAQLARSWRRRRNSRRPVLLLPAVGPPLRSLAAGGLTDAHAPRGVRTWEQYLSATA